jgi:hypothetical protein
VVQRAGEFLLCANQGFKSFWFRTTILFPIVAGSKSPTRQSALATARGARTRLE